MYKPSSGSTKTSTSRWLSRSSRVQSSPQGKPAFYRIAEIHFPSLEALQACATSAGGKETLAHAAKISTGGPPVVLIGEEQVFTF